MGEIDRLLEIMARLRDPNGGCPWDLEQDFASIAPYTIEEGYEVAEAIRKGDMEALRSELGDLLFQIVFHARMAEEADCFDFAGVVDAACEKMVWRHPHVFDNQQVGSAEEQSRAWETHKAEERQQAAGEGEPHSHLSGVSVALPAMTRAVKLQRRAARVGFDWPDVQGVFEKLEEEMGELKAEMDRRDGEARIAEELGDLLFSCANLARHLNRDPESILRLANSRFEERFRCMEEMIELDGLRLEEASLEELESFWVKAKIKLAGR